MNNMESYPSPRKVLVLLLLMDVGVGALHILFSSDLEIGAFFNLAHEENLPTWYSSFQFLLVAGIPGGQIFNSYLLPARQYFVMS